MEIIIKTILIGIGATIAMDIWALVLKYLFQIKSLNYAFVGRWIGNMSRGEFKHENIAITKPIKGESIIGWVAHYLIGITFAFVLLLVWGVEWIESPKIIPAIITGIVTVFAPYFILQPVMGLGIAASKTPNPAIARFKSLVTHTIYGIGLYLSGIILKLI